jgi:hypothetical protein
MTEAVNQLCPDHSDRFTCPDALVNYAARFDEYGLIVHDGGASCVGIQFCPWCGARLPDSKRDLWFDALARRGFVNPVPQDIPGEFESDLWWRIDPDR